MKIETRIFKLTKKFKVIINSEKIDPYELKFAIRNVAKNNSLYFEQVELTIPVETEVEVNNFGRWFFGVKGFKGHYQQTIKNKNIIIVAIPDIKETKELIQFSLEILRKTGIILDYSEV